MADMTRGQKAAATRAANKAREERSERSRKAAETRARNKEKKARMAHDVSFNGMMEAVEKAVTTPKQIPAAERLSELMDNREALRQELLMTRQAEKALQEELAAEILNSEPENDGAVVFFKKSFRDNHYAYSYVAVAVEREVAARNEYGSMTGLKVRQLNWFVSGSRSPKEPFLWSELVSFMGVTGLSTLEVLR